MIHAPYQSWCAAERWRARKQASTGLAELGEVDSAVRNKLQGYDAALPCTRNLRLLQFRAYKAVVKLDGWRGQIEQGSEDADGTTTVDHLELSKRMWWKVRASVSPQALLHNMITAHLAGAQYRRQVRFLLG